MSGTVSFTKMSGTGNDFIVVDNTRGTHDLNWSDFARTFCPRRTSVGADGVLVLEAGTDTDFNYHIFNADGSEAEMCGNGARCAAAFAVARGIAPARMRFTTLAGIIEAEVCDHEVAIHMTDPINLRRDVPVEFDGHCANITQIDTGVPHAIWFVDDVNNVDLDTLGRAVRYHEAFQPAGTNVDFVEVVDSDHINVRTYERGVEAETLACGTGSVASALITHLSGRAPHSPVHVHMPGGDLKIAFTPDDQGYHDVWLIGPTVTVYHSELTLPA